MVMLRVTVVGLLCASAVKEFYRYLVRRENMLKINCFLIHMILLTELFLIWKHGKNSFRHAFISPLGYLLLGSIGGLFLLLFIKVLISDLINMKKKKPNKVAEPSSPARPYFKSVKPIVVNEE